MYIGSAQLLLLIIVCILAVHNYYCWLFYVFWQCTITIADYCMYIGNAQLLLLIIVCILAVHNTIADYCMYIGSAQY